MNLGPDHITVRGACEHNLKNIDVEIERGKITVITGVSGSGKSSLAFDTILAESQRRFFYTLSHYSRQFLDLGSRPSVRHVGGLSPAICLAQNETQPSKRATVGTLTDVTELLGVLVARFGEKLCPDHGKATSSKNIGEMIEGLIDGFDGKTLVICAPVAEQKKGAFKSQLQGFGQKGYLRAFVDGDLVPITPVPELNKDERHTIKIVIDTIKIDRAKIVAGGEKAKTRLLRSLDKALDEGSGYAEYFAAINGENGKTLDLPAGGTVSSTGGCEVCGYSWPKLDARHFSPNSLGACKSCKGLGAKEAKGSDEDLEQEHLKDRLNLRDPCKVCGGSGLNPHYDGVQLTGHTARDLQLMPVSELLEELQKIKSLYNSNPAMSRVLTEILSSLKRIVAVGVPYLSLARRIRSLSAGESQRIKLAGILGESLRGILYVLDEPSQGLHPSELEKLWESIENLRELGNTIIIVDHDESLMRKADWIIDLGPGGGEQGGNLLARFAPKQSKKFAKLSLTASCLAGTESEPQVSRQSKATQFIVLDKLSANNLRIKQVKFPRGRMSVVTGVSGAGKSSLVLATLFPNIKSVSGRDAPKNKKSWRFCEQITGANGFESVNLIDRRPIAKSAVSMPATYLDIFTDIRNIFAKLPEAQIAGLTARSYSLSVEGGRCPECKGRGEVSLSMRFLADARVRCPICHGQRYRPHVLDVVYNGLNLNQILSLSLEEAADFFKNHKKISKRLKPALELGLGYLKLGQPSASLSGGESQRLKIVPHLSKNHGDHSMLVLDEPTTGLHASDAAKLIKSLHRLVVLGATVILIEHNADMINASDWVIDIGPGSAENGGKLIYQGDPQGLLSVKASVTSRYMRINDELL